MNIVNFLIIICLLIGFYYLYINKKKIYNFYKNKQISNISSELKNKAINLLYGDNTYSESEEYTEDSFNETVQEAITQFVNEDYESDISNRQKVYLDVSTNNKYIGKIIIELFDDIVPITTKNFYELCKSKKYQNTKFHRIIKDFMIQGGDIDNLDGRGGSSIYGDTFDDENFKITHDHPGLLSMANRGKNTNGSQFFITTNSANHLDGKHVVFGKVIQGMEIVNNLERVRTVEDKPTMDIYISDCGLL
jgi:cyclophilin family peptidyl-prolyl cis-trans isomerase